MKKAALDRFGIPIELRRRKHSVTRYFYGRQHVGRVVCSIQRHTRAHEYPRIKVVVPPHGDDVEEERDRVDNRNYAASYVLEGKAWIRRPAAGVRFEVEPGTLFFFSHENNRQFVVEAEEGFYEASVCFDGWTGQFFEETECWVGDLTHTHVGLQPELVQAYLDVFRVLPDTNIAAREAMHRCCGFLSTMLDYVKGGDGRLAFAERARILLSNNCTPQYTVQHACREMGMSYDTFRKKFTRKVGMSPMAYQLQVRMDRARLLLNSLSVKETAAQLGYSDQYLFSRQFKKAMGVSPGRYR